MELLHNFMLIHDDIIDRSDLRRGKPTLHKLLGKATKTHDQGKLGYDLSIIAGDIVYALAIDSFLAIKESPGRKERALKYFIKTAAFTAIGEFFDILLGVQKINQVSEEDVLLNYTLKTAKYTFECPLVIGAILAGASKGDIRKLSWIGRLVGQAFQIQDDILGVFGTEKNIGKSILSDLAESKKTMLVCHAYRQLSTERRKIFLRHFYKTKTSYRDLLVIRKIFIQAGSLAYSLQEIKSRLERAKKIFGQLRLRKSYRHILWESFVSLFKTSQDIAHAYNIDFPIAYSPSQKQ
jgi:geranylgeranyl diphosphate synthase type I